MDKAKAGIAHSLIKRNQWEQVLVSKPNGANRLTRQLETHGINAAAIHGNKVKELDLKALRILKMALASFGGD